MQPRGQLWFELQRVCQDFRDFSGLEPREAAKVLVAVLRNLLHDEETELQRLSGPGEATAEGAGEQRPGRPPGEPEPRPLPGP